MTVIDRRYSVAEGIAIKAPCRAATTADVTLSGLQTIDGIALVEHDRVLVWQQSDSKTNGIYEASTGNWLRAKDFDGSYDVIEGTRAFVTDGTVYGATEFMVTTTGSVTFGTSNITFDNYISGSVAAAQAAAADAEQAAADSVAAAASQTALWAFPTKQAATDFAIPAYVPFLFTDGRISAGKGRGWWAPVAGNTLPSHGEYILTNGRYFEPSPEGFVFMSQFGADPTFSSDNNAAFQRAFAFGLQKDVAHYYLGPGQFKLSTALPDLSQGIQLIGTGRAGLEQTGVTAISRCYNEADATRGCFAFVGCGNVRIQDLDIVAQLNTNGGAALSFKSTASVAMGYTTVESCYLTADAGSSWDNTIAYIGDLHTGGTRSNFINNTQIFGGNNNAGYFSSCIHLVMTGGGFFQAGGTQGGITITGGTGVAQVSVHPPSEDVVLRCEMIGGPVVIDHAQYCCIESTQIVGDILNASTVNNFRILARQRQGAGFVVQNLWDKPTCFYNGANITESSSTNGYIYREDGRIEQWMQVTVSTSATAYNFPITFPTKCLNVEVTPKGVTAADQVSMSSGGITASQVALVGTGSITAFVRAVGY